MSVLSTLKLTAAKKASQVTPVMQRRNKLIAKLWEQVQLAEATLSGTIYAPTKLRTITDPETSERKTVQLPRRIKPWWFDCNGKTCISVRYGAKVLTLGGKGLTAIELPGKDELVSTLKLLQDAVNAGELDAQLLAASGATKENFKKA